MSTSYYIVDKVKKNEYIKLKAFWEQEMYPNIETQINKFFDENTGNFINADLQEEVIETSVLSALKYCPISDDTFTAKIGTATKEDFYWDVVEINDLVHKQIVDVSELEKFLNVNTNYEIIDEYGEAIEISTFKCVVGKLKQHK